MDIADITAERMLFLQETQHKQVRNTVESESEEFCIDCDNEIPEKRRQAVKGCTRCIHCQSKHERK